MVRQPKGGSGRSVLTVPRLPNNLPRVAVVRQPQGGLGRGVLRYASLKATPQMACHNPKISPGSLWCASRKADWGAAY